MTRTRLILLVCFVIAFGAGMSAGVLTSRLTARPPERSFLTAELDLTAEQRDAIRKIWSETMSRQFAHQHERRAAIVQERDAALAAILTEEQRAQYEEVQRTYFRNLEELGKDRQRAFDEAVERTRQVLNPEQARRYEEMLRERRERGPYGPRPSRGGGPFPRPGGPRTRPVEDASKAPRGEE